MFGALILAIALGAAAPPTTMAEQIARAEARNPGSDLHVLSLEPESRFTFESGDSNAASGSRPLPRADYPIVSVPAPAGWAGSTAQSARRERLELQFSQAAEGMVVGARSLGMVGAAGAGFAPPKLKEAQQQRLLLRLNPDDSANSDPFAALSQVIDVTSFDMTEFQADVVRVALPTGQVQPFAALAHQYDDLETIDRYGIGAGTRWTISPNANFGTQLLYFPADKTSTDPDLARSDVRWMTRLEINF